MNVRVRVGLAIVAGALVLLLALGLLSEAGGTDADELPIVLTVAPTIEPTPVPRNVSLSVNFAGGLDAIFVPTPTPQPPAPDVPDLPVIEPTPVYYAASTVEHAFQNGWVDGGGAVLKGPAAVSLGDGCSSI